MADDWQDLALNNRRIPHGRLGKRGKAGRGADFDPRKAIGTYAVELSGKKGVEGALEVHGLDPTEEGFVCSFRLGAIEAGVMMLAGSRKVLKNVIESAEAETSDEGDEDEGNVKGEDEEEGDAEAIHSSPGTAKGGSERQVCKEPVEGDENGDGDEGDEESEDRDFSSEQEDESKEEADGRANRRVATFKKNSFRSPKFWGRWRGNVAVETKEPSIDEASAYLVFSKNDCRAFSGTISSHVLDWHNAAITGRKIKSQVRPPTLAWAELVSG